MRVLVPMLFACAPMTQAAAPAPDQARAVFAEAEAACAADDGKLWGRSLCIPLLLVDPGSRAVASNADGSGAGLTARDGIFVGTLPATVNIANTALDWEGRRRAMLMWPLPEDAADRRALLMHESWHGVQDALGLPAHSPNPAHLATPDGRIALRLEWRALAAALRASDAGKERLAIADALAFRAWRRRLDARAAILENQLELNEGLAEYTGQRLSGRDALDEHLAATMLAREDDASFVRSFAYASGPAYGRLLDRHAPDWRSRLRAGDDLGDRLAVALSLHLPGMHTAFPAEAARRHGHGEVAAEEQALAVEQRKATDAWRARLVDGPTVFLPFRQMNISFDPGRLFALPPQGTVYPTLRIVDAWGVLEANDGALIGDDWSGVTLPGPATLDQGVLRGPGWSLPLADGWRLDASGRRIEKP